MKTSMDYVLDRVPTHIRSTFSDDQVAALREAERARQRIHALDWRLSIPAPSVGRIYFSIRAGREMRSKDRLIAECQTNFIAIGLVYAAVLGLFLGGLYSVRLLGMDIFEHQSPNLISILAIQH